MALLSSLVAILEEERIDSGATLNLFARRLREAGRVAKAGRGRGAAHMDFIDAARLIIACAATDHPEKCADAEFAFSNTQRTEALSFAASAEFEHKGDTLDQCLAHVLASIADGTIDGLQRKQDEERAAAHGSAHVVLTPAVIQFDVFRSGVSASINIMGARASFQHPTAADMIAAPHYDQMQILAKAWQRDTLRFRTGKNLHASIDGSLLRRLARAVAGHD